MPALISAEQEHAIARRGEPLLLAAGAGSGKTAVLVERFVRAVREDGLAPSAILAITFTESAAAEVKERVRARLLELGERGAAGQMGAAFVSTFHAFCARLLRAHALAAGLEPRFEILDEGLAARAAEQSFADALRAFVAARGSEGVDLLAAYGSDRLCAMVLRVHAELRARGQRRPRLPEASAGAEEQAVRACALLDEVLRSFGERYEDRKRARGALDFDDLELCALELLREREAVRALWSRRFELLMVDEFQDTNPRQLAILRSLDRENLFTVGDELQSIYGFRDADVGLFRARRAELAGDARSLRLTRNYRSRAGLLDVVNVVFEARLQGVYTPLLAAREEGEAAAAQAGPATAPEPEVELLLVDKDRCDAGEVQQSRSAPASRAGPAPWRVAEARMLAGRVAELVRRGEAQPAPPWAGSGAVWRCAICSPTCARWPTPSTRSRCTPPSPARWWGSPATPSCTWPASPARAAGRYGARCASTRTSSSGCSARATLPAWPRSRAGSSTSVRARGDGVSRA